MSQVDQCCVRPDMTRNLVRGAMTGLYERRHTCVYCGRHYYADDLAEVGADRPCPALLRKLLADARDEAASLRTQLAERDGDLRYDIP